MNKIKDEQNRIQVIIGFTVLLVIISFTIFNKSDVFNAVTSISTLITTIFIFYTLQEMQIQRKASYQPTLIIPARHYWYVQWDINRFNPLGYSISQEKKQSDEPKEIRRRESGIPLYNVGLGAAKNLKVNWLFDLEKYVQQFSTIDELSVNNKDKFLEIKCGDFYTCMYNKDKYAEFSFDYILPISIDEKPVMIPIPDLFFVYYFSKVYLTFEKINFDNNPIIPSNFNIKMKLLYNDIGNNPFSQIFNINIGLASAKTSGTHFSEADFVIHTTSVDTED